jgi:hypothetical protein
MLSWDPRSKIGLTALHDAATTGKKRNNAVAAGLWCQCVSRAWDLREDRLVRNLDVGEVIFIRIDGLRMREYPNVSGTATHGAIRISTESSKLVNIRNTHLNCGVLYVWIDTICIDKSNLLELDEAIRSMHNWYSNCRAVV